LRGHVEAFDVTEKGPGDCVGHGTQVAGIIGAQDQRSQGVPFLGVAPEARIISVKMAVAARDNDPRWVGEAIRKAADLGAQVINVSSQTPDIAPLRSAVKYAQEKKDVLIVAAAGNITDQKQTPQKAYPAAYPGVVSVGALNQNGTLATFSNAVTPVTVTAPGQAIISTYPGGYIGGQDGDGTSLAAPFVAGTAALVRSYNRRLNYLQVKERIEKTADGGTQQGTGSGVVNPLNAVTSVDAGAGSGPAGGQRTRVEIARPAEGDRTGRTIALSIGGATLVVAVGVAIAGVAIPAGRRRGWRPDR
jgi:subtilisin family serine protease